MAHSDSEGEEVDDLEFENGTSDADAEDDAEVDDDILDALDNDADDVTEGDDDSPSEDSDEGTEEDDDDDSEHSADEVAMDIDGGSSPIAPSESTHHSPKTHPLPTPPQTRQRSLSPAQLRKKTLLLPSGTTFSKPRSYTVEAVCAIAHPVPTHALASSLCMSHLLTGSDDGYIRDYDIFSALNGKTFLTAPQRHHCGVVEGIMKAGQIRCWWENPDMSRFNGTVSGSDDPSISPVYSLLLQSDALWSIAGSNTGHINLFTVRHEPGRLFHVMNGHRGPVSALAMEHDEKGYFSAGWDGEALQWDLNTGQIVRKFTAHGAQLVGIAVRPTNTNYFGESTSVNDLAEDSGAVHFRAALGSMETPSKISAEPAPANGIATHIGINTTTSASDITRSTQTGIHVNQATNNTQQTQDSDTKSEASYDPLFDEPDADGVPDGESNVQSQQIHLQNVPSSQNGSVASTTQPAAQPSSRPSVSSVAVPKNAPPLLDAEGYSTFSSDILMTASIDGQVILWDKRVNTPRKGVGRLEMSEKTPPWCVSACWSADGAQMYAGRRNGTIDVWDVRQLGRSGINGTPRLMKTLRNPTSSGVVSCVVAFPDGRHIASASNDNIRLWNASDAGEPDASGRTKSGVQFKIIPGHHGGYISQMVVDPAARFLVSASSNRGWHGDSTRTVFVHDIKHVQ